MPFQPGNNVGRQFKRGPDANRGNGTMATYNSLRPIFRKVLTPEKMEKLVEKFYRTAMKGDVSAMKEILARAWGPQSFEHELGDGQSPLAPVADAAQQTEEYDFSLFTVEELETFLALKKKAQIAIPQ